MRAAMTHEAAVLARGKSEVASVDRGERMDRANSGTPI
jgi:hypothetical protein